MNADQAQVLALRALGWLAQDEDLMGRFLGLAGTDIDTLRAQADQPETLGAVLDFLLSDEAAVRAFCTDQGYPPTAALQARAALPGGQEMNWT